MHLVSFCLNSARSASTTASLPRLLSGLPLLPPCCLSASSSFSFPLLCPSSLLAFSRLFHKKFQDQPPSTEQCGASAHTAILCSGIKAASLPRQSSLCTPGQLSLWLGGTGSARERCLPMSHRLVSCKLVMPQEEPK